MKQHKNKKRNQSKQDRSKNRSAESSSHAALAQKDASGHAN